MSAKAWNDSGDPYLVMAPQWGSKPVPDDFLPLMGRMRKSSVWGQMGYKNRIQNGRVVKNALRVPYRFSQPVILHTYHLHAIDFDLRVSDGISLPDMSNWVSRGLAVEFGVLDERGGEFAAAFPNNVTLRDAE